jgi:predicted secreted hydrolase
MAFLKRILALWLLLSPGILLAWDFQPARPGRPFSFPRDHGAHPEYKTEWWYFSGHLKGGRGENFGYQLTFFRVGLRQVNSEARSRWRANTVYFAHLALTDVTDRVFRFWEKAQRGALGLAGAATLNLKVWVDDWQAEAQGEEYHLRARSEDLSLELTLTPLKPPVLHGEGGFSRKAALSQVASHYYSITRLATRGQILWRGRPLTVTGMSWFDREFSSSHLAQNQVGWDWFALQLDDGFDLMLYLMRLKDGHLDPASAGTLVDPEGKPRALNAGDFQISVTDTWKSPHSGAVYPAGWRLVLPKWGYDLKVTPALGDQELRTGGDRGITYWEGQVLVQGTRSGQKIEGKGYVELTGYAGPLGGRF